MKLKEILNENNLIRGKFKKKKKGVNGKDYIFKFKHGDFSYEITVTIDSDIQTKYPLGEVIFEAYDKNGRKISVNEKTNAGEPFFIIKSVLYTVYKWRNFLGITFATFQGSDEQRSRTYKKLLERGGVKIYDISDLSDDYLLNQFYQLQYFIKLDELETFLNKR